MPQLDHTGQECALYIPRPAPAVGVSIGSYQQAQGTSMKDQEESPGKNSSEEVPALHGMMGCVWHSSVSGNMRALNVVVITKSLCVTWALAIQR